MAQMNVEENNRSAPGPISMKNGTYSSKTIRIIPKHITKKFTNQFAIKPKIPFLYVALVLKFFMMFVLFNK